MSETMIATLIGSGVTLITTMVTLFVNSLIETHKSQLEIQQKKYEVKREKLNDIYAKLVDIVNQYPNSSPNDVLQYVEYAPYYSMESFDAVLKSLDYQIEDYKKQLNNVNINYDRKSDSVEKPNNHMLRRWFCLPGENRLAKIRAEFSLEDMDMPGVRYESIEIFSDDLTGKMLFRMEVVFMSVHMSIRLA